MGIPGYTEALVEEVDNEISVFRVPQLPSRKFSSQHLIRLTMVIDVLTVSSPVPSSDGLDSIKEYAHSLLKSLPELGTDGQELPSPSDEPENSNSQRHGKGILPTRNGRGSHDPEENEPENRDLFDDVRWTDVEKEASGGLVGCREAVEILTRNPKKGMLR